MPKKYDLKGIVVRALNLIEKERKIHRFKLMEELNIGYTYTLTLERYLRDEYKDRVFKGGNYWIWAASPQVSLNGN